MITGIVVNYNTPELLRISYGSVRRWHNMPIIIIDGSDDTTSKELEDKNTLIVSTGYNIGHGRGLHMGLTLCQTPLALIFDSDIEMLKSPVKSMTEYMGPNIYGVGWVNYVGEDGFDYGTPGKRHKHKIPYLHPYFALINVEQYFKFQSFIHHGAPCYKAMRDIYIARLSGRLISHPLITGHTSGRGINWRGRRNKWIKHDFGGTRAANRSRGIKEIDGIWE